MFEIFKLNVMIAFINFERNSSYETEKKYCILLCGGGISSFDDNLHDEKRQ